MRPRLDDKIFYRACTLCLLIYIKVLLGQPAY